MKKRVREVILALFIIYCSLLAVILFLRNGRDLSVGFSDLDTRLNLVPFKTIRNYMKALEIGNVSETVVRNNLIGNFLLFLPMGYFLPIITKARNFLLIEIKVLILIVLVEVIQLITGLGSFDIDDIILNLTGSIIGYVIFSITNKFIKKTDR